MLLTNILVSKLGYLSYPPWFQAKPPFLLPTMCDLCEIFGTLANATKQECKIYVVLLLKHWGEKWQ